MEKIKAHIEKIRYGIEEDSQGLEDKKANLEKYIARFDALMAVSDEDIKRVSNNKLVLENDPVYNSENASYELKESIKQRKLIGMSQEEFEDNYKAVLNGINLNESQETGLAKITETTDLDIVPTSFGLDVIMETGNTEDYLVRKCQKHDITNREFKDIVYFQNEYETRISNIFKWMEDNNLSLDEVGTLLEVRENFTEPQRGKNGVITRPSMNKIIDFADKFKLPLDSEVLTARLGDVYCDIAGKMQAKYIDAPINEIIRVADAYDTREVERALEIFNDDYSERFLGQPFVSNNPSIVGKTSLDN